jgi:5-amino-6-(5-phospho-D-ribitylamino)uracil phosphatase
MPKISLVAVDLDGTLLNRDKTVSPKTKRLIQQAIKRNTRIVIATTRNLYYVQYLSGLLGIDDPVICSNGAHIVSAPFGEVWAYQSIPTDVALRIAQIADEHDWAISSTVGAMKYVRQRSQQALGQIAAHVTVVNTNAAGIVGPPLRMLMWHPEAIAFFSNLCQTELGAYCSTETYYAAGGEVASFGIFPAGADKGTALTLVLHKLNLTAEAVLAIGDNDNDMPLFAQAGLKVAVDNASVALKACADVIAPDHNNDGVGWAIEQFVL